MADSSGQGSAVTVAATGTGAGEVAADLKIRLARGADCRAIGPLREAAA
jgi:hypothetical protein